MNLIGLSGYIKAGKSEVGSIIQYLTTYPKSLNKTDDRNRSYNSFKIDVGMGYFPDWEIKGFSHKLKEIAGILLGVDAERFEDQEFKSSKLGEEWDKFVSIDSITPTDTEKLKVRAIYERISVRKFLQILGTEALRDNVHPNIWVNALFADYHGDFRKERFNDKWIITDVRFPNEAQAIKDRRGIVVRINRKFETFNDPEYGKVSWIPFKDERHSSETSLDDYKFDYILDNNGAIEELIEKVREMLRHYNIIS